MKLLLGIIRFIVGWMMWFFTALMSAILSLLTFTVNEVNHKQDMKTVITHLLGESVWKAMFLKNRVK